VTGQGNQVFFSDLLDQLALEMATAGTKRGRSLLQALRDAVRSAGWNPEVHQGVTGNLYLEHEGSTPTSEPSTLEARVQVLENELRAYWAGMLELEEGDRVRAPKSVTEPDPPQPVSEGGMFHE